jgi:hypothetical protein
MTDTTTTAPARIWDSLTYCAGGQIICYAEKYNDEEIEYIRADLTDAIVRAALERAADLVAHYQNKGQITLSSDIRALANDPAERAAIIKKAEEQNND